MADNRPDYLPELLNRLQQVDKPTAQRLLFEAAQQYPADPRPLVLLAAQYMHAKEVDRAEAAFTYALQRAPMFPIARFQLGLLQLTSGRPATAQATWAPLDQLPEKDPLRLFKTGLLAMAADDFSRAQSLLLEGIAQNTENEPLNKDMRMVLDQIAQILQGGRRAAQPSPASSEADSTHREAPAPADPPSDHFLVSSYGKN